MEAVALGALGVERNQGPAGERSSSASLYVTAAVRSGEARAWPPRACAQGGRCRKHRAGAIRAPARAGSCRSLGAGAAAAAPAREGGPRRPTAEALVA